jgi:hypothetical protein
MCRMRYGDSIQGPGITIMPDIQPHNLAPSNNSTKPMEYIEQMIVKHFEQRREDIAGEEFEVSGDYSVEELVKKFL